MTGRPAVVLFAIALLIAIIALCYAVGYVVGRLIV
ncbi:MAG: hypothetical protein RL190_134 [Actinomycetota bacterium]